jgi:nicotinamidase-related amidase
VEAVHLHCDRFSVVRPAISKEQEGIVCAYRQAHNIGGIQVRDRPALLIIDVQLGMFQDDAPVHKGEELLSTIGDLIARARAAEIPVIYVQHSGGQGHLLEPGTPGWPIHPVIAPVDGELVVHKHYPDSFRETSLQEELKARGVGHLIIAGIQTEYCVDTTCRRASGLGYDVTLVEDGHSTWDTEHLGASQIIDHHNQVLSGWFVTLEAARRIKFVTSQ